MQEFKSKTIMSLPKYYIPKELENAIKNYQPENKFSQVLKKLKNIDCLEIAECHYFQCLKLGLYLEEYKKRTDTIRQFQIKGITIEKVPDSDEKFKIKVDELDETNPFLNVSDLLIAYEQNNQQTTKFFFTVVKVCSDHVVVSANKIFCKMHSESAKYNILLKFNNYWFQCCHYALTAVNSDVISLYIFPEKSTVIAHSLNYHQTQFNQNIFNNSNQKQAVYNIINKSSFPAPYILYGPPGTGKTSTVVEAICQLWQRSNDYILICAPSNAACDVVTKSLLRYIPPNNLYRIYSRTEEYSRINEDIKKCCNFKDYGKMNEIDQVDFSRKKIIITTLCTSLRLERLKLPFSHLFVDEGGQATLTDILLPLCALKYSRSFQIVISGDPHQLGPNIRSMLAEPLLGQSILEKLMKHDPYKKDAKTGYNPRYITKLTQNFRSSKEIIHVPNVLFYDNELIACNKSKIKCFPVAFYAIEGKEQTKAPNSKSPYNEDEIQVILLIIKRFIGAKLEDKIIKKEDIGIVTPFKLQVLKIREKLNSVGLEDVDVGTVEIFQGQEKEIIIISTVRSETFMNDGVEHIGFLSNPKRFNVALTRAKTFLAVVGNPKALQTDKHWRYFIRFCQENNTCVGNSFLLKDEISFSLQDLTNAKKIKKSTDLFDRTFTILKIDDGVLNTKKNKNKNVSNRKNAAVTSGSMTTLTININEVSNSKVSSNRMNSLKINLNSTRNSSAAVRSTGNINSVQNSSRITGIHMAAINVNSKEKNVSEINCRKRVKDKNTGCFDCRIL